MTCFKETVMCHRHFNGLLIELIINLKFLSNNGTLHEPTVKNMKIDRKMANAGNASFSPNLLIDLLKVQCLIGNSNQFNSVYSHFYKICTLDVLR